MTGNQSESNSSYYQNVNHIVKKKKKKLFRTHNRRHIIITILPVMNQSSARLPADTNHVTTQVHNSPCSVCHSCPNAGYGF